MQTHFLLQPLLDAVNALIDSSSWMDCQSTTDCADHIYEGVVDALRLSAHTHKLLYKKRIREEQVTETSYFTNDLHETILRKSGQEF